MKRLFNRMVFCSFGLYLFVRNISLLMAINLIFSCKKQFVSTTKDDLSVNSTSQLQRESTLSLEQVNEWLENERYLAEEQGEERKVEFINDIITRIDFQNMWVEALGNEENNDDDENAVVIPLVGDYFSTITPESNSPLQYLVLIEDSISQILRGSVAFFYPADSTVV